MLICKALKFPRSTYYKALLAVPSKRQMEADNLKAEIRKIYIDSKCRYGAPKIYKALKAIGKNISLKRIQRYMFSMGLPSIVVKKFRPYSSKSSIEEKENLLNRDFKANGINQKWCTDITYIYTIKEGWTYLATVMDLYSRKIIGYAYETTMTLDLVVKVLENVCLNVKVTKDIILHSNLGT
ncbi:transposase InsO family protein [Defluviitalea raffinosedens]|nr:transposase InsO family protein [Defluviitalea raffinosedens]